jgi:hypothetical protein
MHIKAAYKYFKLNYRKILTRVFVVEEQKTTIAGKVCF